MIITQTCFLHVYLVNCINKLKTDSEFVFHLLSNNKNTKYLEIIFLDGTETLMKIDQSMRFR